MVLISAVKYYINQMLQDISDISGKKVLFLDSDTVSIVSVVYSKSELLQKVVSVEDVDSADNAIEAMSHLKAIYFVRPTSSNIQHIKRQLASPRFGEYHLFFSNILNDNQLDILEDSDEHAAVRQVQELYADFVAVDPHHFTLNIPLNHMYMLPAVIDPSKHFCDRVVDGLAAIFLALNRRPVIRYSRTSDVAKRIAVDAGKLMYEQESGLFDFGQQESGPFGRRTEISPLLLVIDRRDDPVTPLLNQWTYQAMVHELVDIEDNKLDLENISMSKDQQGLVLLSERDTFFKENMYKNFGDIGMSIKRMVDDFYQVARMNQNIQTVGDMKDFVDSYKIYREKLDIVSKHGTLVTELSEIVEKKKLMVVSETEQKLACKGGQEAEFEAVENLLDNKSVSDTERLRVVMLYALRYEEKPVFMRQMCSKLAFRTTEQAHGLVKFLLTQAGTRKRTGDLFNNARLNIARLNIARNMAHELKGVENVSTPHQPLVFQIMETITNGRLSDVHYPFVETHSQQASLLDPQAVVIFIIGGTTFEESRSVAVHNASNTKKIHFLLGGSTVLNFKRFVLDLEEAQRNTPASTNRI